MTKEIQFEDQLADEIERGMRRAFAVQITRSTHLLVTGGRRYQLHEAVVSLGQCEKAYVLESNHSQQDLSLLFDTVHTDDGRTSVRFVLQIGDRSVSSDNADSASGFAIFIVSDITEQLSAVSVVLSSSPNERNIGRVIVTTDQKLIDFLRIMGRQRCEKN